MGGIVSATALRARIAKAEIVVDLSSSISAPIEVTMLHANRLFFLLSLLMAFSSCASPRPAESSTAAEGYNLRIDGNNVSLAFTRDLTVPEFLQLAQQVTSARYVYNRDQVANAGPVTLVGNIHCQRSEFPSFVGTMLHKHGLRADVRGSGDMQYVEIQPIGRG